MSSKSFSSKWIFIFAGVIVGLLLAAGLQWTHTSQAQEYADKSVPMQGTSPTTVDPSGISIAEQLSNAFAAVAEKVSPSVVTVFTETDIKVRQPGMPQNPFGEFFGDEFFKRFFQVPEQEGNLKQRGLGSGIIIRSNGVIITNNHVVDGADDIKVRLMDGREFKATVKGRDKQTDLAVITIEADGLQPIQLGNSDQARVGEWVLAIGSPLNPQLEHTVTSGIISAKGRSAVGLSRYEDYIQTDAAINPGNSGGALVNLKGQLIGVNSAIATRTGGFMGIGFAIPVNLVEKVTTDIIEKGSVDRGWLGVYIQDVTPEIAKALKLQNANGVIVSKVQENSPASRAGLREEDVIVAMNGVELKNSVELSTRVAGTSPGTEVTFKILRDGRPLDVKVKLELLKPEAQALAQGESQQESLGLTVSNITPDAVQKYRLQGDQKGVVVSKVEENSLAAQVGIREGDVVIKINRKPVSSVEEFAAEISKARPGENVLFYLKRGEANLFTAFTMPGK